MNNYKIFNKNIDLINILEIDSNIDVKLHHYYKDKLYKHNIAYLTKKTAFKLKKANDLANKKGFKIRIYEAYRPYYITKLLCNKYKKEVKLGLLGNGISWHNVGMAVDVSLVNLKTNRELLMPTKCCELILDACRSNKNSIILKEIMNKAGFVQYTKEWWHFFDWFDENDKRINIDETKIYNFKI